MSSGKALRVALAAVAIILFYGLANAQWAVPEVQETSSPEDIQNALTGFRGRTSLNS